MCVYLSQLTFKPEKYKKIAYLFFDLNFERCKYLKRKKLTFTRII